MKTVYGLSLAWQNPEASCPSDSRRKPAPDVRMGGVRPPANTSASVQVSWPACPNHGSKRHRPECSLGAARVQPSLPFQMSPNLDCALEQCEKRSWTVFIVFNIHCMTHGDAAQRQVLLFLKKESVWVLGRLAQDSKAWRPGRKNKGEARPSLTPGKRF